MRTVTAWHYSDQLLPLSKNYQKIVAANDEAGNDKLYDVEHVDFHIEEIEMNILELIKFGRKVHGKKFNKAFLVDTITGCIEDSIGVYGKSI